MIYYILLYIIFIFILNLYIKKNNIIKSYTGSVHQTFANLTVPLVGGIYILIPVVFFYFNDFKILLFFYILFFILGLFSDLNILHSAKKRFFLQIIILILFVYLSKLEITSTRIYLLDIMINNIFLSYFFTLFCLIVLINGSNFIDGLNSLLLIYLIIIFFFLLKLDLINSINSINQKEFSLVLVLLFIVLMNFFNQLFLGDSGAYSLSFLTGVILINIYNFNQQISPFFIILLLWYPCFENLFSIFRKIISKKNPLKPDNEHLHYHLYIYFINKFSFTKLKSNNISSILINLVNFVIFYFASKNIYHTGYQVSIITVSIIFYCSVFYILKKRNFNI